MTQQQKELVGQIIDRYRVTEHLASGGMADVYLAVDTELGRDVVLKVLLPGFAQRDDYKARFRREARATAQLSHPNIVMVYGFGELADERPYLVMQHVRGGTLQDQLQRMVAQDQLFTTTAALKIMRTIADALHAAHEQGIIHRDLKPSNILIDHSGAPVVSDLGIASVKQGLRLTQTGDVLGTPYYMSPEQAEGEPVDARSDIYSLGVMLYELLTGSVPFPQESYAAVLLSHVNKLPPSLARVRGSLSPQTVALVEKCLQKDPDRRYQSAAELVAALDEALAAERGTVGSAASGDDSRRALLQQVVSRSQLVSTLTSIRQRFRWWRRALGVLLLVIVGGVIVFTQRPSGEEPAAVASPVAIVTETPTATIPAPVLTVVNPTSTTAPTVEPSPQQVAAQGETAVATGMPSPTATGPPRPDQIVFQSNRDGDTEIYVMAADGSSVQQLTRNNVEDQFPAVSPDGGQIVFQSDRSGSWDLYRIDVNGGDVQRLTASEYDETVPTWSPDGRQIAFLSDQNGSDDIFVMDADGSNVRPVFQSELDAGSMSWSINDTLAFHLGTRSGSSWEIYTVNLDGSNVQQLTDNSTTDWSPEWSPDGRFILYLSALDSGDPAIHIMNWDGSGQRILYNSDAYEWGINWTPDGRRILFSVEEEGVGSLYGMNADGTEPALLTERAVYPSWSPTNIQVTPEPLPGSDLVSETGVAACVLAADQQVTADENARLWTEPDVIDGTATLEVGSGAPLTVVGGPVWGRVRRDVDVSGWWWQMALGVTTETGWVWQSRIRECTE